MKIFDWRPKNNKLITRGRIQHALFGAFCVVAAGFAGTWFHNEPNLVSWGQWGLAFTFFFALIWEGFTPWIAKKWFPKWGHPYGDFPDWMAYFVGAIIPLFIFSRTGC